jgi:sugar lactone lactonase YvrE
MKPPSHANDYKRTLGRVLGRFGFRSRVVLLSVLLAVTAGCGDGYTKYLDGPQLNIFVGRPDAVRISGSVDGYGTSALFNTPSALAVDGSGNLYVADQGNHSLRKVTPERIVSTLAGVAGTRGDTNGPAADARFAFPSGIAVDKLGNVYVADTENHLVRKLSPTGEVTTLAGQSGTEGATDGGIAQAKFSYPVGLAVDSAGNVFVADSGNSTIRKVTPDGTVSTIAGSPGSTGAIDGLGEQARLYFPSGIVIDNSGNLYVSDKGNFLIRKISPAGEVSTVAGTEGLSVAKDGLGADAAFLDPRGIALDAQGNLYVADTFFVRKIAPSGLVSTFAGSGLEQVFEAGTVPGKLFGAVGVAVSGDRLYIAASHGVAFVIQIR